MLLSDNELRKLLPSLAFETDEHQRPFIPDAQVQPCSIDLRLDRYVWVPIKPKLRAIIDFTHEASHGEMDMKRLFRQRSYRQGDGIKLKPGEMILARTFEKFTLPNGYAGKLEARSTFARLGLSIHCTGDFINPGWSGRMPLQLVNHGKVPIVLTPYLSICQLLIVETTTPSGHPYGSTQHKYSNDAGGPSRYWLDQAIAQLQEACGSINLPEKMTKEFLEATGGGDSMMIDRFCDFKSTLQPHEFTSAREVMELFADHDTRRCRRHKNTLKILQWICFVPVTVSLGALFKTPYGRLHYWFWTIGGILLLVGLWVLLFAEDAPQAFTRKDVEKYFNDRVP